MKNKESMKESMKNRTIQGWLNVAYKSWSFQHQQQKLSSSPFFV